MLQSPHSDETLLPRPNPDAIHAAVPEGAVLYLPETEHYFGMSPVALLVWELLPVSTTLGDVCRTLAERYPEIPVETLRTDVAELLADLERHNLVLAPRAA